MKKMTKKAVSVGLAATMALSLTACNTSSGNDSTTAATTAAQNNTTTAAQGNNDTTAAPETTTSAPEAYNLTEIKAVVNGTLTASIDNGQQAFVEQWEKAVGEKIGHDIKLNITQLDHSGYVDAVGRLFVSGDYPDVMIMSADMYKQYANTGLLWDMTDAYNNAEFQNRLDKPAINEALKIDGKLYGFAPAYGNGCVTYVKKAWLDAVGIDASTIKTYDDYLNMLVAFHDGDPDGNGVDGDTYGMIAAGYIGNEAPYINYLPEFWQDAYPALTQDADGVWYDGFQTDAAKAALQRMADAVAVGAIDPETLTASTKIAREKWFSNDQTGSAGVFTYWAGTWYQNLTDYLSKNDVDSELVMLEPIAEVGAYLNREAPVWVIIDDGDGDSSREQAIFDTFIDTMMDGDFVQTLWTYGAEGVHWSTAAEEFTLNAGTEKEKKYSYEEGKFHLLPSPNDPNTLWKKNAMDPALVVSPLTNGYSAVTDLSNEGNVFFTQNCVDAPASASCDAYTEYSGDIYTAQLECITSVVTGEKSVDEAMDKYIAEVGAKVQECLDQLNAK